MTVNARACCSALWTLRGGLLAGDAGLYVIFNFIKLLEVQEWNVGSEQGQEYVGEAHALCCYFAPKLTNNHEIIATSGSQTKELIFYHHESAKAANLEPDMELLNPLIAVLEKL